MYNIDDIKLANNIFYYLVSNKEINEEDSPEYFRDYCESQEIMNLVKSQGEAFNVKVEKYGTTIYLIPNEDNNFLGFSKNELKKELCKSNATDKDYYLSQFVILTLLVEFYSSQGRDSKSRDSLRGGEFLNIISDRLKEAVEREDLEKIQADSGIAYENIYEKWEGLRSSDQKNRQKTTKEGFISNILKFLENQGLINYIEHDDIILTTSKLDNFMNFNILNKNNYERVLTALGGHEDE
ncbi:DUF6063 family protein [Intestinibacter sp.]|uniref:DUF6063 family protein n=1 Tax=Intestinibacter sp. TaxID=1965304 RepID=UPI003F13586C